VELSLPFSRIHQTGEYPSMAQSRWRKEGGIFFYPIDDRRYKVAYTHPSLALCAKKRGVRV